MISTIESNIAHDNSTRIVGSPKKSTILEHNDEKDMIMVWAFCMKGMEMQI